MTDQLRTDVRAVLSDIVAVTPPAGSLSMPRETGARRRPSLALAAAVVAALGIAGFIAIKTRSEPMHPQSPTTEVTPTGRSNGALTDPHDVDFTQWLAGAPSWPPGQPTDYLVFDVSALTGWTQLDAIGGHQIGDGPSYVWDSNVNDPSGRQFHLTISNSALLPYVVTGEPVEINGVDGVAGQGEVSWPLDATHTATVVEFGTTDPERAVALARQLTTSTVPALTGVKVGGAPIAPDAAAAFSGTVDGVAWSASATPDSTTFIVDRTTSGTLGGGPSHRLAGSGVAISEMGNNGPCVPVAGYLPNADTFVQLVLSDGITIGLPTQPLDDGEQWFAVCLPYALDAVAIHVSTSGSTTPIVYPLDAPFMRPTVGTTELTPQT